MTDETQLRDSQYKTSKNLMARAGLHRYSTARVAWFDWLFDYLLAAELPADARIVDIGGGPGTIWRHVAARVPNEWQILHTDFSPGMVEEARKNINRAGSGFEVVDAERLPYADASFDAVMANHMLYHVPDRAQAIREFARVLKPNGRLLATTNSARGMSEIVDIITTFNQFGCGALEPWPTLSFTLEGGSADLAADFGDIAVNQFDNVLEVTEAEPLVAYITSRGGVDDAVRAELRAFVVRMLDKDGMVRVRPRSGELTAAKKAGL